MRIALAPWIVVYALAGCDDRPRPTDALAPDTGAADAAVQPDASGLPICPSPAPVMGSPCNPSDACMIPGMPCYFVYTCVGAAWSPHTVCPPPDAGP